MSKPSIIERATFNVPSWYTEEQVKEAAPRCIKKAAEYYERKGYTILQVFKPFLASQTEQDIFCPPDARRYVVLLRMGKPEHTLHFDIPDHAVPAMEEAGLVLQE